MSLRADLLAFDRAPYNPEFEPSENLAFDRRSLRMSDVDGRLHVESCNISKAVVNPYWGREIPDYQRLGLNPNKLYRLYRHPDELARAADSFRNLQLLDYHTPVTADDPKMDKTCGTVGSDIYFEAPYLKTRCLAVWTRPAIDAIRTRQKAELSSSYRYRADMTPGVTPGGIAYDGVMRDIKGNHVALVKEGRAGPDVCVSDSLPTELREMRFKNIIDFLVKGNFLAPNVDTLALDIALDKRAKDEEKEQDAYDEREEAMDAREEETDKREEAIDSKTEGEEGPKGDRKAARDSRKAARDKRAKDRKAARDARKARDTDPVLAEKEKALKGGAQDAQAAVDAAISTGRVLTPEAAQKMVKDAVAGVHAVAQAREDVKPLVGVITAAMDSAEAVYEFALDQAKISHAGITGVPALSALVAAEVRARKGGSKPPAMDSAAPAGHSVASIFLQPAK